MVFSKKNINWGECIVPGLTFVFALVYFIQVKNAPWGAIYWPALIATILLPIWVLIIYSFALENIEKSQPKSFSISWFWKGGSKVSIIFIASIGYLISIPYLGFSITNFIFLFSIFRLLGNKNIIQNFSLSFIITLFLHLSFIVAMKLELPQLCIGPLCI